MGFGFRKVTGVTPLLLPNFLPYFVNLLLRVKLLKTFFSKKSLTRKLIYFSSPSPKQHLHFPLFKGFLNLVAWLFWYFLGEILICLEQLLFPLVDLVIWSFKALPCWGKILDQNNIHNRWKVLFGACPFCFQALKNVRTFLIHCPFSSLVWSSSLSLFDV